jgi:F-type H+-transporting ATPase subunit b
MSLFNLNATLIAELVLFAIVAFVIARVVIPPLRQAMAERQALIRKGLDDAQAAEDRLAEADIEYERRLAAARREGRQILVAYEALAKGVEAEARRAPDHVAAPAWSARRGRSRTASQAANLETRASHPVQSSTRRSDR